MVDTDTWITRRGEDKRINLRSNELVHPRLNHIYRSFSKSVSVEDLWQYPRYQNSVPPIAAYFSCSPDEMLVSPGSDFAIRHVCAQYIRSHNRDGRLLLQAPNYDAWHQTAESFGLETCLFTAQNADSRRQGQDLVAAVTRTSRELIAISVPNGPAGSCMPRDMIDELAAIAEERDHLLVIDGCYQAFHGRLTAQVDRRGGNVLVIQSLSKSHGLAGARLAVVCGTPKLLASIFGPSVEHCVSGPSLRAALLAVEHHSEFADIWDEIQRNRTSITGELRSLGIEPLPSGANFLSVRLGSSQRVMEITQQLSHVGFRVRDVSSHPGLTGCIRFTVADSSTMAKFKAELYPMLREC